MTTSSENTNCAKRSKGVAACGGLAVFIILVALGIAGFFASLIIGVIVALGLGVFLSRFMCPDAEAAQDQPQAAPVAETPVETAPEPVAAPDPAPVQAEPTPEPAPEPAPANETTEPAQTPASASERVKPTAQLPGQVELSSRKGTWKYEGQSATT